MFRSLLTLLLASGVANAGVAPTPAADYGFAGSLTALHRNAPALMPIDPGANFTEDTIDMTLVWGWAFPEGAGLRLPTSGLIPSDNYSVSIVMEFDQTVSYAKILDTKSSQSDHGLYANGSDLRFYTSGSASTNAFVENTPLHVVVTRATDGTYRGYINGMVQFNFFDSGGDAIISAGQLVFFRDDDGTGNEENSAGTVYRIRLFDRELSAQEVIDLNASTWLTPAIFVGQFESLP